MLWMLWLVGFAANPSVIELVTETRTDRGVVRCALFDKSSTWLEDARQTASAPIEGRLARCQFLGVEPGVYAVVAFHDENQNQELDLGFLGIPKEGYAASNQAHRVLGKPSFEDARFRFEGGRLRLRTRMSYLSLGGT